MISGVGKPIKSLKNIVMVSVYAGFGSIFVQPLTAIAAPVMVSTCPDISRPTSTVKVYDAIVFGDQVPGVMTALQVQRELRKRNQAGRVLLITEGDTTNGIGGHLVRWFGLS